MGAEHDGEWDAEKMERPQGEGVASDVENNAGSLVGSPVGQRTCCTGWSADSQ